MFRRFEIEDPTTGSTYMIRWTLFSCRLFSIKLHRFLREDWTDDLHDHPWPFVSFVLRGFYIEEEGRAAKKRVVKWLNWKKTTDRHRVFFVKPGTLTLVISGRKSSDWGFYEHRGDNWVPWQTYLDMHNPTMRARHKEKGD